jgi:alpha/beta superfamily hydrolase
MPALCPAADLVIESVYFPGDPYRLEGELVYADGQSPVGAVVLAGPHPVLGGNIRNNVLLNLGDGLARHNLVSLRFNYRGVGRSEGPVTDLADQLVRFWQTSHVPDEVDYHRDLGGAIAFVRSAVDQTLPLALVGYSFGCSLLAPCLPMMRSQTPLVLVAPTLSKHDYAGLESVTRPKLIIASENDFVADADRLQEWFDRLAPPKQLIRAQLDSHFFRGHEEWLVETVSEYLQTQWRC